MKVRLKWKNKYAGIKAPFNGNFVEFERVPCIGETLVLSGIPRKVCDVTTVLDGWNFYYIVVVELYPKEL